jgi:ribosomal protein S8
MISSIPNILNGINMCLLRNNKILKLKQTHIKIIMFLYKNNFIESVSRAGGFYYVKINLNMFLKIKNLYRSNAKLYISYNQIIKKKIYINSATYILSSHLGLINQYDAIKKKCGGFLVGKILIN